MIAASSAYTVWEIYAYLTSGDSFQTMASSAFRIVLGGFVLLVGGFLYSMFKAQLEDQSANANKRP